jgi:metallophosphoesterase superfamily enzyme
MKYYVTADPHAYYTILKQALTESGFFADTDPHKLIILGDLFDRGSQACELQEFILDLMEKDQVILIKGNHEDLFEELVTEDHGIAYRNHVTNGTFLTVTRGMNRKDQNLAPTLISHPILDLE